MQITGTITSAQPPDSMDNWQNQWQNVVITKSDGTRISGRIGSKKGYSGGEQITVQVNQGTYDDGSPKITFKRINPQQAQQGQRPPQQADNAEGKVRHGLVCAYIQSGQEPNIQTINYWTEFIVTGNTPPPPGQTPESLNCGTQEPWET